MFLLVFWSCYISFPCSVHLSFSGKLACILSLLPPLSLSSLPPSIWPSLPLFLPPPSPHQPLSSSPSPIVNPRQEAYQMRQLSMSVSDNKSAAASLRAQLKGGLSQNPGTPQSKQGGISTTSTSSQSPSDFNGAITPISGPRKRKREGRASVSLIRTARTPLIRTPL